MADMLLRTSDIVAVINDLPYVALRHLVWLQSTTCSTSSCDVFPNGLTTPPAHTMHHRQKPNLISDVAACMMSLRSHVASFFFSRKGGRCVKLDQAVRHRQQLLDLVVVQGGMLFQQVAPHLREAVILQIARQTVLARDATDCTK